jgi:hypothetical protein
MTDPKPVACSLGAGDLQARLTEIAEVGAVGLIAHEEDAGRHTLRFRPDPMTRRRLEEIVAAEGECCSFLDLDLAERDGELVLMLAAPKGGQPIADELAVAFAGGSDERR